MKLLALAFGCALFVVANCRPDHHEHHGHGHGHGHGQGQDQAGQGLEDHSQHGHGHDSDETAARDCAVHHNAGQEHSGVYRIKPDGCHHAIDVLCDMETDSGGWTVIQRRGDYGNDADFFYKTWNEYKDGFGELEKEFWIGNYHINHLTEQGDYELRIDMWDLEGHHIYAHYGHFRVENETRNYAVHLSDFSGDTRDCMSFVDGMSFSTRDRDNDLYESSCAEDGKGAWWYRDCSTSNLNGPHLLDDAAGDVSRSIYWFGEDGNPVVLGKTKMMVRPRTQ